MILNDGYAKNEMYIIIIDIVADYQSIKPYINEKKDVHIFFTNQS